MENTKLMRKLVKDVTQLNSDQFVIKISYNVHVHL